jgi:hypothetical protein
VAAFNNILLRALAAARLVTKRLLTPWAARRFGRSVLTTITTTVRMVDCIHMDTTDTRTNTLVAVAPGFADLDILVLFVSDDTDTSGTLKTHQPDFSRW